MVLIYEVVYNLKVDFKLKVYYVYLRARVSKPFLKGPDTKYFRLMDIWSLSQLLKSVIVV